jgi:hypothetical protein
VVAENVTMAVSPPHADGAPGIPTCGVATYSMFDTSVTVPVTAVGFPDGSVSVATMLSPTFGTKPLPRTAHDHPPGSWPVT